MKQIDLDDMGASPSILAMEYTANQNLIEEFNKKQEKLRIQIDNIMNFHNCHILFYNGEYIQKCNADIAPTFITGKIVE